MKKHKNLNAVYTILLFVALLMSLHKAQCQANPNNTLQEDSIKAEAFKYIHLPEPVFKPFQPQKMDSAQRSDMGFEQVYKSEPVTFQMRDGKHIAAQKFNSRSNTTLLLLHGVLSSSFMMNKTAGLLREATNAEVIAIDFRGHGQSDGVAGDVDYIDQYADDLADIISTIKLNKPGGKIIIAAHSMGGGIALRYAMKKAIPQVNGYLLFAPLLGQNSPAFPKPSVSADTTEPFMKIDFMRIIGLKMYNSMGIYTYDSLPVIFFNLPESMPLHTYTYRSNASMAPDDYKEGLKAVKKPMLVLVGSNDEAFVASEFTPAVTNNSKGEVIIIDGATHNGILHNANAMAVVKKWFHDLNLTKHDN